MLPAHTLFLQIRRKRYQIESLAQASTMFCKARDASGNGASKTPTPLIVDENGAVIGHVSYNGRVWPGTPQDWKSGTVPLYDNGTGLDNMRKREIAGATS